MGAPLYARPSDNLATVATISVTAGAADASYPATNVNDGKSHSVVRSTGTSITLRATFGASKTLEAVALINTNATGATLTNGAGLNESITIPTTPEDGLPLDPWIDLRGLANTGSTTWDIALTGPSGVGLGELLLIETLRDLPLQYGLKQRDLHRCSLQETDYGVRLKYSMGVRRRSVAGGAILTETLRAALLSLQRDAFGPYSEFLLIPDADVNDALCVDLTAETLEVLRDYPLMSRIALEFTEAQKGLAL